MRRAYRRKFHYIYKTTCKITGKYYIGMHSTDDLNDGYVGSGKRLWYSINKHGKENHVCEILEHFPDREALRLREAELVNEALLTDPKCMNLKLGGEGGFEHINTNDRTWSTFNDPTVHAKANKAATETVKRKITEDPEYAKMCSERGTKGIRRTQAVLQEKYGINSIFSILNSDPEVKEKRKLKMAEIGHQQGEKNSQFGTCWISSKVEQRAIKINKVDLDLYLSQGWSAGRKF